MKRKRERTKDLLEEAWGIIANVDGGEWNEQGRDWREAARIFKEKFFCYLNDYHRK